MLLSRIFVTSGGFMSSSTGIKKSSSMSRSVKSSARAVEILEILAESNTSLNLSNISRVSGIPKSSLHGILRTLTVRGWVTYSEGNNSYSVGLKSLKVGARFLETDVLANQALPLMSHFRDKFGETINLGRFDGYNIIYLSSFESSKNLRKYPRIGRSLPAYSAALGKSILAHRSMKVISQIYKEPFIKLTNKTVANLKELEIEISKTIAQGYAIEHEQSANGFSCIAVSINNQFPPIDSLSVSMPKSELTKKKIEFILPELFTIAQNLAR
jgi:DNA-binding IclR family transcriptional regulator